MATRRQRERKTAQRRWHNGVAQDIAWERRRAAREGTAWDDEIGAYVTLFDDRPARPVYQVHMGPGGLEPPMAMTLGGMPLSHYYPGLIRS